MDLVFEKKNISRELFNFIALSHAYSKSLVNLLQQNSVMSTPLSFERAQGAQDWLNIFRRVMIRFYTLYPQGTIKQH